MLDLERLFNTVKIEHVWIFFTDKCNLDCEYCFYRDRTNKQTLPFGKLKVLLDKLSKHKYYCFVISGGEPLLEWDIVKKIVMYVKESFKHYELILQTNGIFLDEPKVGFLKEYNVVVEHGIDGRFSTTSRYRIGTTKKIFNKIIDSIKLVVSKKLRVNPTIAVCPSEVSFIYKNFLYLVSLGLYSVDIHPALLEPWKPYHIPIFKNQYLKILEYERKSKRYLVCKDYHRPISFGFDLVVMPDGNVLPNWVYLMLPKKLKEKFFFLKIEDNSIKVNEERLRFYLKSYHNFYRRPNPTYREFSNLNVQIMLKEWNNPIMSENFENYRRLTAVLKKINQKAILLDKIEGRFRFESKDG